MARRVGAFLILLALVVSGCGRGKQAGDVSVDGLAESGGGGLSALLGGSSDDSDETGEATTLKTGDVVTNSIGMKLGVLPPGSFSMGSPETEEKRSGDESTHTVRLSKPAFMGIYEVTQAEFQRVMETNPSGITDSDRLPVQNISWEQAVAFCRKLSELPEEKSTGRVYRLPTEAEWEYACRAGSTTPTSVGSEITSSQANFDGNYPYGTSTTGTFLGKPQEVGSYEPNAWGLYDLHGNVWEWCSDWYAADYYSNSESEDPQGPDNGISHVIRGGSWYNFGYVLRSAYRSEFTPPLEANIYGFRVVASLGPNDKFAASELDNPNPTPMTSPSTPAVASSPAKTPPVAASSMAGSSSMMESMPDSTSIAESDSAPSKAGTAPIKTPPAASTPQPTRRTSAATAGSIVRHVILIPAGLVALLMLVDPARLNQPRHYDLLPLLFASTLSVMPSSWLQAIGLVAIAVAVTVRLVIGLRNASLPKAVVPKLKDGTLLTLTVVAFIVTTILEQAASTGSTVSDSMMSVVAKAAVVTALFVIGKRWKNRTLGLAVAFLWLVLPMGTSSIAAALFLWAFVFLQRAPLAGVLFGMAIAANWWLCFLLPLWVSYFRGKARMRFLTVSVTCGIIGLLLFAVLPAALIPGVATSSTATSAAASVLLTGIYAVVLALASAATWFWPKVKSETVLTVLSAALLLLGVVVSCRTPASLSLVSPWLVLVLTGGSATLGRPIVAEGLVTPSIRRLTNSFARVHRSS